MSEREFVDGAYYWLHVRYHQGAEDWIVGRYEGGWRERGGFEAAGHPVPLRLNEPDPMYLWDLFEIGPMIGKEPPGLEGKRRLEQGLSPVVDRPNR
jgi:hypothetical protein